MTTETPTAGKKKSVAAKLLRPKVAIPLLILFLLLISPFLVRGWYLRGVPDVAEPFDIEAFSNFQVPDKDNAYTGYAEALDLFVQPDGDFREKADRVLTEGWQAADDDIRQFLKDNEQALLVWKEATGKDQAQYLPAHQYGWDTILPVAGEARSITYGALLLAEQQMAQDQPEQAWEWYRAAIRASRHVGKNGGLVERLVGTDCFELTARQLEFWLADPAVSKELILHGMQQLEQDWELTEENARIIQLEYLTLCSAIESMEAGETTMLTFDDSDTRVPNSIAYIMGEPELGHRLGNIFFRNKLKFYPLEPYLRPPQKGKTGLFNDPDGLLEGNADFTIDDFERSFARSQVAQATIPAIHQPMIDFEADELRHRTLLVVFAGQAFRRDHGRFPQTLDELVPEYLHAIPIDTCDGKPLKYRFDAAGPVVYSIFENRTDDGGVDWHQRISSEGHERPDDLGSQMRLPAPEPLAAPKP